MKLSITKKLKTDAFRKGKKIFSILMFLISFFLFSNSSTAGVRASYLYNLSDFSGPVPYQWPNISVDIENNEIYVVDTKEGDIRVYNENGMEIYRFGEDGTLGNVISVSVRKDGDILLISKNTLNSNLTLCNFRGEQVSSIDLKGFPKDFSGFSPDRIFCLNERIYMADSASLRIAVTDTQGVFLKGYDLALLLDIEEKKRLDTELGGFNIDREGNMLFTIPVLFAAYTLSYDGEIRGFGASGGAPGKFGIIGGIAADSAGNIYVADRLKSVVLIFDKTLKFQKEFGYRGPKQDNLVAPKDIAIDSGGKLYVSQLKNRGISVFQIAHD